MLGWRRWSTADDKGKSIISNQRLIRSKKKPPAARPGALFLLAESESSQEDLSALIDRYLTAHPMERRDRALLTELVYGIFRQRGFLDWQIDHFSKVKKIHPAIRNILRLGLYQLLFLDKIPPSAAVNTSVDLAKEEGMAGSRFVNGLLRNILRQKDPLPAPDPKGDPVTFISVTTSHPEWMVRRWIAHWGGEKTLRFCQSNNEVPPTALRVNVLKMKREDLARRLEQEGATINLSSVSPFTLFVRGVPVSSLPSYQEGLFYVQDEGAQLISDLVDPQPGENILDLCAAPGGKTTHLAELAGGRARVTATDLSADRLHLIQENLIRLQTPGIVIEALAQATADDRRYDRILIDAPCSALGILRRIPEGKWRKKPSIIPDYAGDQRQILEQALMHLKVGGRLIYATCSTEPEENEEQAAAFEKAHPELRREDPSGSLPEAARKYIDGRNHFTTRFNSDKMDTFFAVRWVRVL